MREPLSPPIDWRHASGAFSRCFRWRDRSPRDAPTVGDWETRGRSGRRVRRPLPEPASTRPTFTGTGRACGGKRKKPVPEGPCAGMVRNGKRDGSDIVKLGGPADVRAIFTRARHFDFGPPFAGDPWDDRPTLGPNVSRFLAAIPAGQRGGLVARCGEALPVPARRRFD